MYKSITASPLPHTKSHTMQIGKIFNLLLADDDQDDLSILNAVLNDHPQFNVVGQFFNGSEIVGYLQSNKNPDMIITDMYMPIMAGTAVIDHLLETGTLNHMRIIVFSTTINMADAEKYEKIQNVHFFEKPNSLHSYGELAGKILDCFD